MSIPDAPDNQRAVVSAQRLLGQYASGISEATIFLAPDVWALWIFAGPGSDPPAPTVTGVASGVDYPCYAFSAADTEGGQLIGMAIVSPPVDASVTVQWGAPFGASWYVVGDTGPRFALDPALAASTGETGVDSPLTAVMVAGYDGTHLRFLLTDNTGKLQVSGVVFPPVYAAPGAGIPTDALMVGGSDGTLLHPLAVDTTGHLLTFDQQVKLAMAVLGAAAPAQAVLGGGSDGAFIRALLTDAAGHLLTLDQQVKLAMSALSTALPAQAVLTGGSDGTNLRPLVVDATGHLVPKDAGVQSIIANPANPNPSVAAFVGFTDGTDLRVPLTSKSALPYHIPSAPSELTADRPPNEILYASVINEVASTVVVAAPGAGKQLRVFWCYAYPESATAEFFLSLGSLGIIVCACLGPAGTAPPVADLPLTGLIIGANSAVTLVVTAGTAGATVGYTIETT